MATTDVEFSGDASDMVACTRKLIDQNKALQASLEACAKTAEKGAQAAKQAYLDQNSQIKKLIEANDKLKEKMASNGSSVGAQWMSAAAAVGQLAFNIGEKVVSAIQRMIEMQIQYNKELAQTGLQSDELRRKFQVQAMMKDEEMQKTIRRRILPAAQAAGVKLDDATRAATEMISQGFSVEDATGGALKALLLSAQGTNVQDKAQYASMIAGAIKAQGLELNEQNIYRTAAPIAALFNPTNLQAADVGELAKIMSSLNELKIDQTQALATFGVLRNVGNFAPEQAAVGMRNFTGKLSGVRANKEAMDALMQAGVNVDDVDFIGESLPQVLENFSAQTSHLDEPSKRALIAKVFGLEGMNTANLLLSDPGRKALNEYMGIQQDTSYLQQGIKLGTGGVNAAENRVQNKIAVDNLNKERWAAEDKTTIDLITHELHKEFEKKLTPEAAKAAAEAYRKRLEMMQAHGVSPEQTFAQDAARNGLWSVNEEKYNEAGARIWNKIQQVRAGTDVEINAQGVPGVPVVTPKGRYAGPKSSVDFRQKYKTPEELEIEEKKRQLAKAQADVEQARYDAMDPNSAHGRHLSKGEQDQIAALERIEMLLDMQLKQMRADKKYANIDAGI